MSGLALGVRSAKRAALWEGLRARPFAAFAALLLAAVVTVALFAPLLGTVDPIRLASTFRLKPPQEAAWMGTDQLGRDVWSRVAYGSRVSLSVGLAVPLLAVAIGLLIGLLAGYLRWLDGLVMRVMDGLMAIPGILLAVALVQVSGATLLTVIVAILIPEVPRVTRLVRAIVLSVREEPYVEAAISTGTRLPQLLWRHVMPSCVAPLIVQATYIAASAMLTEAILSFLGAGTPPETPSWGNMMAEGRIVFVVAPWIVLFPGLALALTILAVNVLGDGLRDRLDPRIAKRV